MPGVALNYVSSPRRRIRRGSPPRDCAISEIEQWSATRRTPNHQPWWSILRVAGKGTIARTEFEVLQQLSRIHSSFRFLVTQCKRTPAPIIPFLRWQHGAEEIFATSRQVSILPTCPRQPGHAKSTDSARPSASFNFGNLLLRSCDEARNILRAEATDTPSGGKPGLPLRGRPRPAHGWMEPHGTSWNFMALKLRACRNR